MAIRTVDTGTDRVQKSDYWTQNQIDEVEQAKARQRDREQEANQQRLADQECDSGSGDSGSGNRQR